MSQEKMILNTFYSNYRKWKTVGKFKRKTNDKVYESPRIVLPSEFNQFIGKRYQANHGRATKNDYGEKEEGDYILLFFPDRLSANK